MLNQSKRWKRKKDMHDEGAIVMYPSSRAQDKELAVKKRDIQMRMPLEIGMNFVVPPYKPLKLKRSSNFEISYITYGAQQDVHHPPQSQETRTCVRLVNSHRPMEKVILLCWRQSSCYFLQRQKFDPFKNASNRLCSRQSWFKCFDHDSDIGDTMSAAEENTSERDADTHVARQPAIKRSIKRSRRSRRRE